MTFKLLPEGSTKFIIVHVLLGFLRAPKFCNFLWISEFEFSALRISFPGDDTLVTRIVKELKEKLPQLKVTIFVVRKKTSVIMNIEI